MTAKDLLIFNHGDVDRESPVTVSGDMHLLDVTGRLIGSPTHTVGVTDASGDFLGVIDSDMLLEGIGTILGVRDDTSVLTLRCMPRDYSASSIARAVEDTDAHLVDLLTSPGEDGSLKVTLRVQALDPSAVEHSLERYGYEVEETVGHESVNYKLAAERLLELQTLLNI